MFARTAMLEAAASAPQKMPAVQFPVALWWLVGACVALMLLCLLLTLIGWYFKQPWILKIVETLLPAHLDRAMNDDRRRRRR